MHKWALTENMVDKVIAEALDLTLSQYFLFGRILSFRKR